MTLIKSGPLWKQEGAWSGYCKYRFVVAASPHPTITYSTRREAPSIKSASLQGCKVKEVGEFGGKYKFTLEFKSGECWQLAAESATERIAWLNAALFYFHSLAGPP
ncbi:hypothetical protein DUNSADRAFT_12448, partial [Dunaliella salina]